MENKARINNAKEAVNDFIRNDENKEFVEKIHKFMVVSNIYQPNFISIQKKVVDSEIDELNDAESVKETLDAIGDIAFSYIAYSMLQSTFESSDICKQNQDCYIINNAISIIHASLQAIGADNLKAVINEVCDSNLSKFDETIEDAIKTSEKYESIGIEVVNQVVSTDDNVFIVTKSMYNYPQQNIPQFKVLKSFSFVEPDFQSIILKMEKEGVNVNRLHNII